jgi:hypothetical protein
MVAQDQAVGQQLNHNQPPWFPIFYQETEDIPTAAQDNQNDENNEIYTG